MPDTLKFYYYYNPSYPLRPYERSAPRGPEVPGSLPPDNALLEEPTMKEGFWPCEQDGKWVQVEITVTKKVTFGGVLI